MSITPPHDRSTSPSLKISVGNPDPETEERDEYHVAKKKEKIEKETKSVVKLVMNAMKKKKKHSGDSEDDDDGDDSSSDSSASNDNEDMSSASSDVSSSEDEKKKSKKKASKKSNTERNGRSRNTKTTTTAKSTSPTLPVGKSPSVLELENHLLHAQLLASKEQHVWREFNDPSGRAYFVNEATKESIWKVAEEIPVPVSPPPTEAVPISNSDSQDVAGLGIWLELVDEQTGFPYMYNESTGESRWKDKHEPATAPPPTPKSYPRGIDNRFEVESRVKSQAAWSEDQHWKEYVDENGHAYQYNEYSGESKWVGESSTYGYAAPTPKSKSVQKAWENEHTSYHNSPNRSQWYDCVDANGHAYQYNESTGESRWVDKSNEYGYAAPTPKAYKHKERKTYEQEITYNSRHNRDSDWQNLVSDEGHPYQYNTCSGESRWVGDNNTYGYPAPTPKNHKQNNDKGRGWQDYVDANGHAYQFNSSTGESRWVDTSSEYGYAAPTPKGYAGRNTQTAWAQETAYSSNYDSGSSDGWKVMYDRTGRSYQFRESTGEVWWIDAAELRPARAVSPSRTPAPETEAWVYYVNENGYPYQYNEYTGESRWIPQEPYHNVNPSNHGTDNTYYSKNRDVYKKAPPTPKIKKTIAWGEETVYSAPKDEWHSYVDRNGRPFQFNEAIGTIRWL